MISISDFKGILIAEHKRDLRITIIRNVVYSLIAIAIGILIYFFAYKGAIAYLKGVVDFFDETKNPGAVTYKYLVGALLIGGIAYQIYAIIVIKNRQKLIEEFISKIENGKIASNISNMTVYKLTLPILKVNLKLLPVNFAMVYFNQENKMYKFPVPEGLMPDMRSLLSGVQSKDLDKAWYELYDGQVSETSEVAELKSSEEFQKFVAIELADEIDKVEKKRDQSQLKFNKNMIPTILIMVVWIGIMYGFMTGKLSFDTNTLIIGFVGFFVIFYAYIYLTKVRGTKNIPIEEDFDIQFKTKVFSKMINYINPNFKYVLHGHISLPEFMEMGFFQNKNYKLAGNDQIIGNHSGVPFQLCDLDVDYKRNFSKENEGPDLVFFGQVFIAKFNKSFKNDVFIVPRKFDYQSDTDTYFSDDMGDEVKLEDPEFSKLFKVYAHDQVEARYILSTSLMQRIKNLAETNPKGKFLISFRNNRISIANHSKTNNFEVARNKSITKNNQTTKFYEDLVGQLKMIDDLKLNVNIWKN